MPADSEMQTVPFIVFEGALFDYERRLRRLKGALVALALALAVAVAALGVCLARIPGVMEMEPNPTVARCGEATDGVASGSQ